MLLLVKMLQDVGSCAVIERSLERSRVDLEGARLRVVMRTSLPGRARSYSGPGGSSNSITPYRDASWISS